MSPYPADFHRVSWAWGSIVLKLRHYRPSCSSPLTVEDWRPTWPTAVRYISWTSKFSEHETYALVIPHPRWWPLNNVTKIAKRSRSFLPERLSDSELGCRQPSFPFAARTVVFVFDASFDINSISRTQLTYHHHSSCKSEQLNFYWSNTTSRLPKS